MYPTKTSHSNRPELAVKSKKRIYFVLVLTSIIYISWELYWYNKVHLLFVRWHTHIIPLLLLFSFSLLFFGGKKSRAGKIITAVLLFMFILESMLTITGILKTNDEKNTGYYLGPLFTREKERSYYHIWESKLTEHELKNDEYTYTFPTNSLGYPDIEWSVPDSSDKKIRIAALGDSFTEGDGAPYDSSYVKQLEKLLNKHDENYYLMNAGVCGSDPFFNYINLKDRILSYKPNIVLQTLSSHDIYNEQIVRGGLERFNENNKTVSFHSISKKEVIFASSYISRIFFKLCGYDETFIKNKHLHDKRLTSELLVLFEQYRDLCQQNNILLFIILRPDKQEIKNGKYEFDYSPLRDFFTKNNIHIIDLLPAYTQKFKKENKDYHQFFWEKDGHHNSVGYQLMAECIYEKINPVLKTQISESEADTIKKNR